MNITPAQLKKLAERYRAHKINNQKNYDEAAFKLALTYLDNQCGEAYLALAALGSDNDATFIDHQTQWEFVCHFLDNTLIDTIDSSRFDQEHADDIMPLIRQKIDYRSLRNLHDTPNNLGIREKYVRGILTDSEWLTDLDLHRLLQEMGLHGKINICPFNSSYIADILSFAEKTHQPTQRSYNVYLLANKGSDGTQQGHHWLAITLSVDPTKKTINCHIDDSLAINETTQTQYKEIIEQTYLEGYTLTEPTIIGRNIQQEGYSCGYHALHTLLQHNELTKGKPLAQSYAKCTAEHSALRNFIYQNQKANIQVSETQRHDLSPLQQQRIEVAKTQHDTFQLSAALKKVKRSAHIIDRVAAKYSVYVNEITFSGVSDSNLSRADYCEFLTKLHNKIYSEHPLKHLYLKPCTLAALQGARDFLATQQTIHIQQLHVHITDTVDALYLDTLKKLIQDCSAHRLMECDIRGDHTQFTDEHAKELADFVLTHQIAVRIHLPEHLQHSSMQKDIDNATLINIRKSRLSSANAEIKCAAKLSNVKKEKRRRPKIHTKNANVDVELQQEVQVEVAVERQAQAEMDEPEYESLQIVKSLTELKDRIKNGQISLQDNAKALSDYEITKAWHACFGNVATFTHRGTLCDLQHNEPPAHCEITCHDNDYISHISLQACEQLLNHYSQLQYGFEYDQLPRGFCLIEYPTGSNKRALHFDKNASIYAEKKPLAPVLLEPSHTYQVDNELLEEYKLVLADNPSFQRVLDELQAATSPEYQREKVIAIRRDLPALLQYGENEQHVLLKLLAAKQPNLLKEITSWAKKLAFNRQQYDALLDVYNGHGLSGLQTIFALWKKLEEKKQPILSPSSFTYANMLDTKRYESALETIERFTKEQYIWWNTLLEQHITAVQHDDLTNLVAAFEAFSTEIQKLTLRFYLPIAFTQIKSLPIALARMLAILKNCAPEDIKTQWQHISQLSLQSDGAIRAMTDTSETSEACRFIAPQMQASSLGYNADTGYKITIPLKEYQQFAENKKYDLIKFEKEFYRYLAHQKFKRPIEDYYAAIAIINDTDLHLRSRIILYRVLAESTTGATNFLRTQQLNQTNFLSQWKEVVETACSIKLPPAFRFIPLPDVALERTDLPSLSTSGTFFEFYFFTESINGFSKIPPLGIVLQVYKVLGVGVDAAFSTIGFTPDNPFEVELPEHQIINTPNFLQRHAAALESLHLAQDLQQKLDQLMTTNNSDIVFSVERQFPASERNKKFFLMKYIKFCAALYNKWNSPFRDELFRNHHKAKLIAPAISKLLAIFNLFNADNLKFDGKSIKIKQFSIKEFKLSEVEQREKKQELRKSLFRSYSYDFTAIDYKQLEIEKKRGEEEVNTYLNNLLSGLAILARIQKPHPDLNLTSFNAFLIALEKITPEQTVESIAREHFGNHLPAEIIEINDTPTLPVQISNLIASEFKEIKDQKNIAAIAMHYFKKSDVAQLCDLVRILSRMQKDMAAEQASGLFNTLATCEGLHNGDPSPSFEQFKRLLLLLLDKNYYNELSYLLTNAKQQHIKNNLMVVAERFLNELLPSFNHFSLNGIKKIEALEMTTKLLLASKMPLISYTDMLAIADDPRLHAFNSALKGLQSTEINASDLLTILERLFSIFPTTKHIEDIHDLYQHAQLAQEAQHNYSFGEKVQDLWESTVDTISGLTISILEKITEAPTEKNQIKTKIKLPKPTQIDTTILEKAVKACTEWQHNQKKYIAVLNLIISHANELIKKFPSAKSDILSFCFLHHQNHLSDPTDLAQAIDSFVKIKNKLIEINDTQITFSLFFHYSSLEENFNPETLFELLNHHALKSLKLSQQKTILSIISVLLDNEQFFSHENIDRLLAICEKTPTIISTLNEIYTHAPYPNMSLLLKWMEEGKLLDKYKQFDLHPCERESGDKNKHINGFDKAQAILKAQLFSGFKFFQEDIDTLSNYTNEARSKSTGELLMQLNQFKQSNADIALLVSIAAELLYRAKGKEKIGDDAARQWGRSFEINTTQYLAIYAMLKSGKNAVGEIATGEGKSRIFMLLAACQFALGKTVDFVTSDMALAKRDYTEYQAYFKLIGASSRLIYADSPASHYAIGGINISDDANISLLRNKARSESKGQLVIDPDNSKRALLHDEGDKALFDTYATRFNFSSTPEEAIRGMEYIYPILIEFFDKRDANNDFINHAIFYDDIDGCTERFLAFAASHEFLTPTQRDRLKTISQEKLETWQASAMTALSFKFDDDFTIIPDTIITTAYGPKAASKASILINNQQNANSIYSFGVHQCLHARLNRLIAQPHLVEDIRLKDILKKCTQPFYVEEEKQIVYSSTTNDLFNDYCDGTLISISGTAGSPSECEEVSLLRETLASTGTRFINVPRHKGLKRVELPVQLVADDPQLSVFLADKKHQTDEKNQPSIIFCENDDQSAILESTLKTQVPRGDFSRIHAKTPVKEEEIYIKKEAGKAKKTTISTSKIGRGTDIRLQPEAKKHGMSATLTYLAGVREQGQTFGRVGRFGDEGDAQLVLRKDALKKQLSKTTLRDGFYTASEDYIAYQQQKMDRKNQRVRLINFAVGDFRKKLTDNFYNEVIPNISSHKRHLLEPLWKNFFDDLDKCWADTYAELAGVLDKLHPDTMQLNGLLNSFREKAQSRWEQLRESVKNLELPTEQFLSTVPVLQLSPAILGLITKNNHGTRSFKTLIADRYHPAHDGRAVVYTRPFELIRATFSGERKWFADLRAWWRDAGILFPNIRAFFAGHLSFSQLILGSFGVNKPKNRNPNREDKKLPFRDTAIVFTKQQKKLHNDLENYCQTSASHTRKIRAGYLKELLAKRAAEISTNKSFDEKQTIVQQTIVELYLHYATIEDASSMLSRSLEKRLIRLLQIPNNDELKKAQGKREDTYYKLHNFFNAGRSFIKHYRDKAQDPVHHIIWKHLSSTQKRQVNTKRTEMWALDKQDRLETALFGESSLSKQELEKISNTIIAVAAKL